MFIFHNFLNSALQNRFINVFQKKAHTKNDKFFCSTCKCSFANNFLLKRHIRAMHPVKLKIKKLNSPEPKMHKRETPSASPLSKKEEQLPSLLQTPTKDSSGLYECTVCHKKLTTTQTLRFEICLVIFLQLVVNSTTNI